jgi:hypothetical protein
VLISMFRVLQRNQRACAKRWRTVDEFASTPTSNAKLNAQKSTRI